MTPPVFSHGSLRLYLLMLLDEQPRHGYELIQALSDRFGGTYVPSAGTIYPRLAKLEDEGLVSKQNDGRKSVYAITDDGRAELSARQTELYSIEEEVSDSVRRLADHVRADVNQAMKTLRADLASAARDSRSDAAASAADAEGTPTAASAATESRSSLHSADVVLTRFRQELRTELRTRAARGPIARSAVELLERRLSEVSAEVLAALEPPH